MPSTSYSIVATPIYSTGASRNATIIGRTTTGFTVKTFSETGAAIDVGHSAVVNATNAQLPDTITQEELDAALNSPGVSAWGYTTVGGGLLNNLNIASMSNPSPGRYEYTFTTPMPNARYSIVASSAWAGSGERTINWRDLTATGFVLEAYGADGTLGNGAHTFTVHATNAPAPKGGTGADAWGLTSSDGILTGNYNVSVTKPGGTTGQYNYTFGTEMPSRDYAVVATAAGTTGVRPVSITNKTTAGFEVHIRNSADVYTDTGHSVVVHVTNATLPAPLTQDDLLFTDGRNASEATQEFEAGIITSTISSDDGATPSTNFLLGDGVPYAVSINNTGSITGNTQGQSLLVNYTGAHDHTRPFFNINSVLGTAASTTQNISSILANVANQNTSGDVYAFHTGADTTANAGTGGAYAFYAEGTAPSYFAGKITATANLELAGTQGDLTENPANSNTIGSAVRADGVISCNMSAADKYWHIRKNVASPYIQFSGNGLSTEGLIKRSSASVTTSGIIIGTRIASDEVASAGIADALDTIKALTPNTKGFTVQDYSDYLPHLILDTDETGIDVDHVSVIPILTKALQEALARIEQLEADHQTLMNNGGY